MKRVILFSVLISVLFILYGCLPPRQPYSERTFMEQILGTKAEREMMKYGLSSSADEFLTLILGEDAANALMEKANLNYEAPVPQWEIDMYERKKQQAEKEGSWMKDFAASVEDALKQPGKDDGS